MTIRLVMNGGHNDKGLHWFITANGFKEDGWRDASPSNVGQLFGKIGWMDARTDLALTMAVARSERSLPACRISLLISTI